MSLNTTVLIVDDVPEARTLMSKILRSKGIETLEAGTGAEALEMVEQHENIDLVLLDIVLPDMDGYEVVNHLLPYKEERNIKVCFVSGKKAKDGVIKAIKAGGDDYLVKPIFPDALLAKVSIILGKDTLSDGYNKVKCGFRASIVDSQIIPDIHVVEISEMSILLRTTAAFEEKMKIEIDSKKLRGHLKTETTFTLKVINCRRESTGKYFVRCGFVGMTEDISREIRALAIRGGFLT